MAGNLSGYRNAIVTTLTESLPVFKTVVAHAGAFGADSLKRFSTLCPAAMVSILQARTASQSGGQRSGSSAIQRNNIGKLIGPVLSAIYIIAKDPKKGEAWAPSIDLAEQVAEVIELNQWGLDYVGAAQVQAFDVLYNATVDSMGLCLSAVSFTQEVQWGRDVNAEDERRDYPDWTDADTVAAGWPKHLKSSGNIVGDGTQETALRLLGWRQVAPPPSETTPPLPVGVTVEDIDGT
jgi:hypothetical protein